MPTRRSWRERGWLAATARVCAVAFPLASAVAGALVVREIFDGVTFAERLAWTPIVLLIAAPPVLLLERFSAYLLALADLLDRTVEFADRPPSRLVVAWRVSSPRRCEMVVEGMRHNGLPSPRDAVPLMTAIAGLERHHPAMRARLRQAHGCGALVSEHLGLPDDERRLVDWLVTLRLTADAVRPPDLNTWLTAALRSVPGAPPAPAKSALLGALAGFAVEFAVLTAEQPLGAGLPALTARRMLTEAAQDQSASEAVEAFRRVPNEALARLAPEPEAALEHVPLLRRVALAPALAGGALILLAVVALSGVGRDRGEVTEVLGVTEANRAPRAEPDSIEVRLGTSAVVDVVANDTDPDGDALTVVRFEGAGLGTLERDGDDLRYTASFSGTDRFTYVVSDGHGGQDEAVVTVTVSA